VLGSIFVPVFVFVVIGRVLGNELTGPDDVQRGLVGADLAVFAALLIAISSVQSLVTIVAIYREGGILKRLRATPLQPLTILAAHVIVKLVFTVATLVLMVVLGRALLPVDIPIPWVAFTAATCVSTLSILSLGFVLASLAPTARFAQPIATVVLYPMIGFSGLFTPIGEMPGISQAIARLTPASYAVSLMRAAWHGESWLQYVADLAGLAIVFAVCTALAVRVFRWE
jgi:ABC-2 type transport system permease protein